MCSCMRLHPSLGRQKTVSFVITQALVVLVSGAFECIAACSLMGPLSWHAFCACHCTRRFGVDCPEQLEWRNWLPGTEYTKQLVLKNVTTSVIKIRYKQTTNKAFAMDFPELMKLRPGMSHPLKVRTLGDTARGSGGGKPLMHGMQPTRAEVHKPASTVHLAQYTCRPAPAAFRPTLPEACMVRVVAAQ